MKISFIESSAKIPNELIINLEESEDILSVKQKLNLHTKIPVDSIQIYSDQTELLKDTTTIGSIQIKNKLLYFKQDTSNLNLLIESYIKKLEKINLNLSYNTSIYYIKMLLSQKLSVSINDQVIYYENQMLDNSTSLFDLAFKYTNPKTIYTRSYDRTSDSTEISSPRGLKLKLFKKDTNCNLSLGLDFSFNCMKNMQKINWDNSAPSFREIEDGLSLIGYCMNVSCKLYNQMFVHNIGFGKYDLLDEIKRVNCKKCKSKQIDIRNLGFVNCEWIYKGVMKQNCSKVCGDGKTMDRKFHTLKETSIAKVFETLLISVSETFVNVVEESVHISEESEYFSDTSLSLGRGKTSHNGSQNDISIDEFSLDSNLKRKSNIEVLKNNTKAIALFGDKKNKDSIFKEEEKALNSKNQNKCKIF